MIIEPKKQINISLPKEIIRRMQYIEKTQSWTKSQQVQRLFMDYAEEAFGKLDENEMNQLALELTK